MREMVKKNIKIILAKEKKCLGKGKVQIDETVEGLNCKSPIQCLASSKILTPQPPHRSVSVSPSPAFGAGGGHTRWVERGWGVNITPDTALYSTYVSTLWMGP